MEYVKNAYPKAEERWLFRGQTNDYGTILATTYRNLWKYRNDFTDSNRLVEEIQSRTTTQTSSRESAEAILKWKINADRHSSGSSTFNRGRIVKYLIINDL